MLSTRSRTLFHFLSRAHCASALGRIRRLHTLHLLRTPNQHYSHDLLLLLQHFIMNMETISRACYSRLRVLHSFRVTPISNFAVRADVRTKVSTITPHKGMLRTRALDITSSQSLRVKIVQIHVSCSRAPWQKTLCLVTRNAAAGSASLLFSGQSQILHRRSEHIHCRPLDSSATSTSSAPTWYS